MADVYDGLSDDNLVDLILKRAMLRSRSSARHSATDPVGRPLAARSAVEQDMLVADAPIPIPDLTRDGDCTPGVYRPLDSVWYGEDDAKLIEQLLTFYPHRVPRLILDATVNGRRFWRSSTRPVIGVDIDPRHGPDVCADNRTMPFASGSFDVVVYDPPHIPNQGRDRSKDFNTRFGLGAQSPKENGYNFAHTYPAFMTEAWRLLVKDGILMCKIVDYIHNHRYQWAHIDLIRAGQDVGFTACDCIIKVRKGPIVDPKWKVAHHSRRQHCYWIIFRKSPRCE